MRDKQVQDLKEYKYGFSTDIDSVKACLLYTSDAADD